MTIRTAYDFQQYAGAYTVSSSSVAWLRPGMIVEFVRYSGPHVWVYDVETGQELVEDVAALELQDIGADKWRILRHGEMLLEVEPPPPDYRPRDFSPPKGYGLLTRFIRPRVPWPDPPTWVSLKDLLDSD